MHTKGCVFSTCRHLATDTRQEKSNMTIIQTIAQEVSCFFQHSCSSISFIFVCPSYTIRAADFSVAKTTRPISPFSTHIYSVPSHLQIAIHVNLSEAHCIKPNRSKWQTCTPLKETQDIAVRIVQRGGYDMRAPRQRNTKAKKILLEGKKRISKIERKMEEMPGRNQGHSSKREHRDKEIH